MILRLAVLVGSLVLVPHGQVSAGQKNTPEKPDQRYFTVKDSIEMARFERNYGEPKLSPDGKYVAAVTSRGLLRSNEVESTVWIFETDLAVKYLLGDGRTKAPRPKRLLRLAAVPKVMYPNSYEPIITGLQWSNDSKKVFFLAQNSKGRHTLYEANAISNSFRALTPKGHDILKFDVVDRNIACLTAARLGTQNASLPTNSAATDVTGLRLTAILFPQRDPLRKRIELWMVRNGEAHRIEDSGTGQQIHLANGPLSNSVLSLSPNGHFIVVLVPAKTIPKAWERYQPAYPYLKLDSADFDLNSASWPAQYAVIDVHRGKLELLLQAPNAFTLGSGDVNQAKWSADGKQLLLTNTYLPLAALNEPEITQNLRPCAVLVIRLASKTERCVVYSLNDPTKKQLFSASFGDSNEDVLLRFRELPNTLLIEHYHCEGHIWHLVGTGNRTGDRNPRASGNAVSGSISVSVKEDLNTPPTLWVLGSKTGNGKQMWNPNPELAKFNLGEASEFRWKDQTGYEWVGGLVKPPNYDPAKRYPLVIQTHGFEKNEFMTDGAYTTAFAARPLASAGIVVLQMPTRHDHMVTAAEALDQFNGFESAIRQLTDAQIIDPEKVGIIGFSRTCYYVETALTQDPIHFKAATIADGVDESYMNYLLFGVGRSHDEGEQIYGARPFGEGLNLWLQYAPGFHLDRVQVPVRIEAIGPGSLLEEWGTYAALAKQEKPVDLIYIRDGQHILQKPLDRLASQQGNVDWFRFWLKGEEDPDPLKIEQYARWRRMRSESITH